MFKDRNGVEVREGDYILMSDNRHVFKIKKMTEDYSLVYFQDDACGMYGPDVKYVNHSTDTSVVKNDTLEHYTVVEGNKVRI